MPRPALVLARDLWSLIKAVFTYNKVMSRAPPRLAPSAGARRSQMSQHATSRVCRAQAIHAALNSTVQHMRTGTDVRQLSFKSNNPKNKIERKLNSEQRVEARRPRCGERTRLATSMKLLVEHGDRRWLSELCVSCIGVSRVSGCPVLPGLRSPGSGLITARLSLNEKSSRPSK